MIECANAVYAQDDAVWSLICQIPQQMNYCVRAAVVAQTEIERCSSCSHVTLELAGQRLRHKSPEGVANCDAPYAIVWFE